MEKRHRHIPDEIIFGICERFLDGMGAVEIARWVREKGYDCTREQVYRPCLQRGIRLGFLRLCPPEEMALAQKLSTRYSDAGADLRVVKVRGREAHPHIAAVGADLAHSLIQQVAGHKERVHIGFSAGGTARAVARALAQRLRTASDVPPLTLHALNSGFSVDDPTTAPVSFFSFFHELDSPVDYVGLFAPAVVSFGEYEKEKSLPGLRESFARAAEIDIVITSLANSATDEHGLLRQFMMMAPKKGLRNLENAKWVGDVLWCPYSAKGPIKADTGIRAITILELEELVRFAATRGKHSIVVAAPCLQCGGSKSRALRPLLEEPSLRVANHIVMDLTAARELLD